MCPSLYSATQEWHSHEEILKALVHHLRLNRARRERRRAIAGRSLLWSRLRTAVVRRRDSPSEAIVQDEENKRFPWLFSQSCTHKISATDLDTSCRAIGRPLSYVQSTQWMLNTVGVSMLLTNGIPTQLKSGFVHGVCPEILSASLARAFTASNDMGSPTAVPTLEALTSTIPSTRSEFGSSMIGHASGHHQIQSSRDSTEPRRAIEMRPQRPQPGPLVTACERGGVRGHAHEGVAGTRGGEARDTSKIPQSSEDGTTITPGVDNTGNIRVWPAEEALAMLLLRWRRATIGRRVLELGAGMAGSAGLLLAHTGLPETVWLTDGNETAASTLRLSLAIHRSLTRLGRTKEAAVESHVGGVSTCQAQELSHSKKATESHAVDSELEPPVTRVEIDGKVQPSASRKLPSVKPSCIPMCTLLNWSSAPALPFKVVRPSRIAKDIESHSTTADTPSVGPDKWTCWGTANLVVGADVTFFEEFHRDLSRCCLAALEVGEAVQPAQSLDSTAGATTCSATALGSSLSPDDSQSSLSVDGGISHDVQGLQMDRRTVSPVLGDSGSCQPGLFLPPKMALLLAPSRGGSLERFVKALREVADKHCSDWQIDLISAEEAVVCPKPKAGDCIDSEQAQIHSGCLGGAPSVASDDDGGSRTECQWQRDLQWFLARWNVRQREVLAQNDVEFHSGRHELQAVALWRKTPRAASAITIH